MKIEVGDKVELNNGEVHEVDRMKGNDPNRVDWFGYGPFVIYGSLYHQDGRFADCGHWHILSVKRILSRASDDTRIPQESEPKMWRDRTDWEKANVPDDVLNDPTNPLLTPWDEWSRAAKGALLLAEKEGKKIEYSFLCQEDWKYIPSPSFSPSHAYRVKPEPVRETVTLKGNNTKGLGWVFGSIHPKGTTHRITFDLIDGEPDCDSIKMEKV